MDLMTTGSSWGTLNSPDHPVTTRTALFPTWTPEDREMFNIGTEFEMDNTLYENAHDELRYLRVVIINTFATWETKAKVGQVQLGEITPFGQILEEYR